MANLRDSIDDSVTETEQSEQVLQATKVEPIKQIKTEYIDVEYSINRILASDVKSKIDSPPFNMSSMDGYAVQIEKKF